MFAIDALIALFVALVLASLLVGAFGWRHPRREGSGAAMLFLLLLFFFAVWAVGAWSAPYGPMVYEGVYFLPFVLVGLFLALIILAIGAAAANDPAVVTEPPPEEAAATAVAAVFGIFFWVLVIAAIAAIIVAYAT